MVALNIVNLGPISSAQTDALQLWYIGVRGLLAARTRDEFLLRGRGARLPGLSSVCLSVCHRHPVFRPKNSRFGRIWHLVWGVQNPMRALFEQLEFILVVV